MKSYLFRDMIPAHPARTGAVVGGGNVAMDSARTALRLGGDVYCLPARQGTDARPY